MKNMDNLFKIGDDSYLEVVISRNKEILIDKDCLLIKQYVESLKATIKDKADGFWDNYSLVYLDFFFEDGLFIKDKYLNKKLRIGIPKEVEKEIQTYFIQQKKIVMLYIDKLLNKQEYFFLHDGFLISNTHLFSLASRVDLYIPSLSYTLNRISKEKKSKMVFTPDEVFLFLFGIQEQKEKYNKIESILKSGKNIDIYDIHTLLTAS